MDKKDFFIGMKLYNIIRERKNWGDKYISENEIHEVTVSEIGNKKFRVKEIPNVQFDYKSLSGHSSGLISGHYRLYPTKQSILDINEANELLEKLCDTLTYSFLSKLDLEDSRALYELISKFK